MKSNTEPVFYGTTMTPSDLGEWYLNKGPGGCEEHEPTQFASPSGDDVSLIRKQD